MISLVSGLRRSRRKGRRFEIFFFWEETENFTGFSLRNGQNFIRVYASECVVVSVRLCTIILQLGSG